VGDKQKSLPAPEPVAQGSLSKNRKGVFRIIFDEIISPNFEDLKTNFVQDVIVPRTMDWLYELGSNMLNDLFKTNRSSSGRSLGSSRSGHSDYGSYFRGTSRGSSRREPRDDSRHKNDIRDWEEISFDSRADAERVISSMIATIDEYQIATIADLFDFSGIDSAPSWADNKYGWTVLDNARTERGRDGRFYLVLPKPMAIEDD